MTNAQRLTHDQARWRMAARQMHREIEQRLSQGDTTRVGIALETLAKRAFFLHPAALMTFLHTCDGEEACWFVVHGCPPDADAALATATGRSRSAWHTLMDTWRRRDD